MTPNPPKDPMQLTTQVEYLFRVAWRLTGNVHDAEDLVQDVCERALLKAPGFASAADSRRWLLRVLFNRFVDGDRHRRRSPLVTACMADGSAAYAIASDPEELAAQTDAERELTRAWARLEPVQQMLLLLRAEGHDLDEISRITDIAAPALSSRLYRARASFARYLDEERSPLAATENAT